MPRKKRDASHLEPVPPEDVEAAIYVIRGERVMVDRDLARLYGVETGYLKRQVNRNRSRFPTDFMFQITREELDNLRCQFGISSWGGTRHLPYAFTEQGVAMLSSVLRTERAVQVNITIMRAFVRARELMLTHRDLARKLADLEHTVGRHDGEIRAVFDAIRRLLEPGSVVKKRRRIGFRKD